MSGDDTEELRQEQLRRQIDEQQRARAIEDEKESAQHARRAEKAKYLREKLDERAESERDEGEA